MTDPFGAVQSKSALHRLSGSHAWVDSARSVIGVAPRQDAPGDILLKQLKANLAPDVPAYAYRLVQGEAYPAHMRVEWSDERGRVERDDLLRQPDRRRDESDRDEVMRLLNELLDKHHGVITANIAYEEGRRASRRRRCDGHTRHPAPRRFGCGTTMVARRSGCGTARTGTR